MGVRKNVRSLTAAEKAEFVNAVKALKASGKYDQYVRRHNEAAMSGNMAAIHGSSAFLPWHRQFILEYEKDLQQVSGNPNLTLPYWNWAEDAALPDPRTAPIWADDFMGGNGDPNDNWIVKRGPFRLGQWTIVPEQGNSILALRRHLGLQFPPPTFQPRPVTLPTQTDVNNVLTTIPYDASPWNRSSNPSFRNRLEGWYPNAPGLHNRGHVWVGGSMLPMTSPNDPVFFLHHSFIDKIWSDWQVRNSVPDYLPAGGGPQGQNLNDLMERTVSGQVTPVSVLNIRALGYSYDTDAVVIQLAQAMRVHGHSMQIERLDLIQSVWRAGYFIRVGGRQNTENWFHFAVPTRALADDKRLRIGSVLLRFRTNSDNAFVHAVHIYNGETRITAQDNLKLSPRTWTDSRFDVPNDPEVRGGVGISVGVRFQGTTPNDNIMEFSSAGCDFLS